MQAIKIQCSFQTPDLGFCRIDFCFFCRIKKVYSHNTGKQTQDNYHNHYLNETESAAALFAFIQSSFYNNLFPFIFHLSSNLSVLKEVRLLLSTMMLV